MDPEVEIDSLAKVVADLQPDWGIRLLFTSDSGRWIPMNVISSSLLNILVTP